MGYEKWFDYSGKVVVVTGGSGVLCSTLARALGQQGAAVVVVGHSNLDKAQAVADDILSAGGKAIAAQADVLDKGSLEALARLTVETYGRVDILINGAGGARPDATTSERLPFSELPQDAVRWVFDLNFLGTFLACQVFSTIMVEQGGGSILNISSMSAMRPLTRNVAYSAAKASIDNFTQWLAVHMSLEYPEARIRVNAIAPGFFLTEQNRFLLLEEGTEKMTPRGERIVDHTPMGRFGDPEDLIGTMLWLLSEGAAFVHGVVVPVDGGFSAYGGV